MVVLNRGIPKIKILSPVLHPLGTSKNLTNAELSKDSEFSIIMVIYEKFLFYYFKCFRVGKKDMGNIIL